MADVDVAALRAALAKATPGPWEWDADAAGIERGDGVLYSGTTQVLSGPWTNTQEDCLEVSVADAELIVLLRNNAEALLDALERISDVADDYYVHGGPTGAMVAKHIRAAYEGIDL